MDFGGTGRDIFPKGARLGCKILRDQLEVLMAKKLRDVVKPGTEKIIPPSKQVDTKASKQLKKGNPVGARVMADASVAKRQKVKRPGDR